VTSAGEPPVGHVGRVLSGPRQGFYVEVDDDTKRPQGTGGFYVLWWTDAEGYDNWVESWGGVVALLSDVQVEWLDAEKSSSVPGRQRHNDM
jgi:hypothetical protein